MIRKQNFHLTDPNTAPIKFQRLLYLFLTKVPKIGCPKWHLSQGFIQTSRLLSLNQSTRPGMFLFLCEVEGGEVKFVQAWCVQRGGLSHTRWRMKGQRWHSLAQEWKTFSPENREATTGRGSAERPWVSMHPVGEVTRLEM